MSFSISGVYKSDLKDEEINSNTDIKNNYIKVVDKVESGMNVSSMELGGNLGVFVKSNIEDPNSTTETHEFGHSLGLQHPENIDLRSPSGSDKTADAPGIMYPRGTAVDAPYTYDPSKGATKGEVGINAVNTMNPTSRRVNQQDISNLRLGSLKYDAITGKAQIGSISRINSQ